MKDCEENSRSPKRPDRINFTKAALDELPSAENGHRYYYDTKVNGLCVGVGRTGRKSFVLYRRIESRPERIPIGPYPGLTVEQARNRALTLIGNIASGSNPAKEKRERDAEITFAGILPEVLRAPQPPAQSNRC